MTAAPSSLRMESETLTAAAENDGSSMVLVNADAIRSAVAFFAGIHSGAVPSATRRRAQNGWS